MTELNTIQEFLETLTPKAPVPGGGGASALAGAIGAALGGMVTNLTIGKKRYADVEEEMTDWREQLESLRREFVRLAKADEEVFAPLAACYSLPYGTEEEKKTKDRLMEENLLAASLVPISIMEKSMEALEILEELCEKGSRMAVSDVGVGVQLIRAALLGAVMNVYINTKSMKDRKKADELNTYADQMVEKGSCLADAIYHKVRQGLKA